MMIRTLCTFTIALAMTTGGFAQKVTTDSNPQLQFNEYKTYSWTAGTSSPNPLDERRIHDMVDAQLAAKSLTPVESDPDVYVATHVITHEQKKLIAEGFGPWGPSGGTVTLETYVQGTLVVDLYDARTKKMIWRGLGTGTTSDKPSKNTDKIDKALFMMFQQYPR